MARDQRTRLNAELAHNYGDTQRKKGAAVTPGRSSLTGEEQQLDGVENELEEQEQEAGGIL